MIDPCVFDWAGICRKGTGATSESRCFWCDWYKSIRLCHNRALLADTEKRIEELSKYKAALVADLEARQLEAENLALIGEIAELVQ